MKTKPKARRKQRRCKICKTKFKLLYAADVVCEGCQRQLPKCGSCHQVMAPQFGYMQRFAATIGKYDICGWCRAELKRKKFLHITADQYLMPDGEIKLKR